VDSENSKNLVSDGRRRLQIIKALADPNHYYSKFTTGNALTLPAEAEGTERIRAALLAFHSHHYKPENMTVTLVGPQSLDELQAWLAPRYGAIPSKPLENPEGDVEKLILEAAKDMPNYVFGGKIPDYTPAFSAELQQHQWPILLTVKPLSSMRKISLNFPLPPVRHLFNCSPTRLLSHLLGHEGPGSSFAILQSAGLLTSLSAGSRISGPDQTLFQIELSLTEEGEKEWKTVVALLLEHCRLIAQETNLQLHWDEMRTLSEIQFNNSSPGQAYGFAPGLASSIVSFGTESSQSAGYLLDKKVPNAQEFASFMKPENCMVERCSNEAWEEMEAMTQFAEGFGKKSEQWYDIEYYVAPIEEYTSWVSMTPTTLLDPSKLSLPKENRFIPRTLELVDELPAEAKQGPHIEKPIDPPNLVVSNAVGRLWHRLDDRYALPKSSLNFFIRNAAVEHSLQDGEWQYDPSASIHSTMLTSVFTQALAQETYDADLAGLHWSLSSSTTGTRIVCSGYSDRLGDLAIKLLRDFLDGNFIQESYVEATQDRIVRSLQTYFASRRADSLASHYQNLLLSTKQSEVDVSLAVVQSANLSSCKAQHKKIVENADIEIDCLYSGNVSEKDAKAFFVEAGELLNKRGSKNPSVKLVGPDHRRLELGKETEAHFASQNPQEENGAVLMTYQSHIPGFRGADFSCPESLQSTASLRLISHMLREPLFDTLRTKQQLGYIVSSYYDLEFSHSDATATPIDLLSINVLSRKVSPPDVATRIDDFLIGFRGSLMNMPESEIRDHADALSSKLLKPMQSLSSEASNHFSKIRRYAPEILRAGGNDSDLPWKSVEDLAGSIQALQRKDLVETWDRVVLGTDRSRVVSMVYGSTFPLDEKLARKRATSSKSVVVNNAADLLKLRRNLKPYENKVERASQFAKLLPSSTYARLGFAAAAVGVIGFTLSARRKR